MKEERDENAAPFQEQFYHIISCFSEVDILLPSDSQQPLTI